MAHLDGVLQISETEALFMFQSTSKLGAAAHLLGVAMAWYNESTRLHSCPPTNAHLRDYVAARGRCPSGTHTLSPGREVVSQSPLVTPTLKRGPHCSSAWPLGTLVMPN